MKPITSNLHKIHEPTSVTHAPLVTNSTPSQARSRFMVTMIWIKTMSTFFTTSKPIPSWTTTCKNWKYYYVFKVKKKRHTHHIVFRFPSDWIFKLSLIFTWHVSARYLSMSDWWYLYSAIWPTPCGLISTVHIT